MHDTDSNPILQFGVYELDPRTGELSKAGRRLRLRPQAGKVLTILASRAGHLVTREELREQIWGRDTYVDFEHGLNLCIRQIREALGDDADTPRYIQTLPRKGYRFIAEVRAAPYTPPEVVTTRPVPAGVRWGKLALAGALAALTLAGVLLAPRLWQKTPTKGGRLMLAVLPFKNLSGDPAQEYLSDGLTEEMTTELSKLEPTRLGVIARTSVMKYKAMHPGLREIGRELGVDYILEGSIRRQENRIRVSVQLIRVSDQTHLWAESYDRNTSDLLEIQAEVARAVAAETELKLSGEQQARLRRRRSLNPEAHEAYLRGRLHLRKLTREGAEKAIEYFQQALALEPRYPLAYAGVADGHITLTNWYYAPLETMPKAREAALKALALDPELAEGHALLGTIHLMFDWDWKAAESEFRRATQLDPNLADGHVGYAGLLMALGRFEESLRELRLAQSLDPMSPSLHGEELWMWFGSRQYDRAITECRRALEIDPGSGRVYWVMAHAYSYKGEHQRAVEAAQKATELGDSPLERVALAEVYARAGKMREAQQVMRAVLADLPKRYVCGYNLAAAYAAMGQTDKAFESLERAFLQRSD